VCGVSVCVCVFRKRVCGVSVYCVFRLCVSVQYVYVLIIHTCHLAPRELFGPSFGYFFFLPLSLLGAIQAHSLTLTHTLPLSPSHTHSRFISHTHSHTHIQTRKGRVFFLFLLPKVTVTPRFQLFYGVVYFEPISVFKLRKYSRICNTYYIIPYRVK
jgi:hypothetical protein